MKIGDLAMLVGPGPDPAGPRMSCLAQVIGGGTATVNPADPPVPFVHLRAFPKSQDVPYVQRVPVYDTADQANAPDAGRWNAFACYPLAAAPAGASDSVDVQPVAIAPPPPPAPVFTEN